MNISFIAGNLLGRAAISYLIVLVIVSLVSKLDWRLALRRSVRWYGLLSVLVLTLAGIGVAASRGGFAA